MNATDPRHGTYAGAVAHWIAGDRPCDACATAETRYRKLRKLDRLHGNPRTVPAIGTLRRWQALQAIGYRGPEIAIAAGVALNTLRSVQYHASGTVRATLHNAVADTYERMCMTPATGPYATRARLMAARKGWAPPLAWDDIDDPDETPATGYKPRTHTVDPVVVEHILAGYPRPANPAERREVLNRWTGSLAELEQVTGWNVAREKRKAAA